MNESLKITDDVFNFLENMPMNKENMKDLIEYVHYKSLLNLFTYFIENNMNSDLDFLLPDYVEVISKIQIIINNINNKYGLDATSN